MTDYSARSRPSVRSLAILFTVWLTLQMGGLFSPGLLDDVDSIYIQIAREMLARHDFVTPTIDGIRFFDKPPLMYWMAAGSMRLFGLHDWAARLPLALGVLALLAAVYALGLRFFGSRQHADGSLSDRGAFYAALAMATAIGPYLYTRFYIPDILIALWMTLSVHLFLIALDRTQSAGTSARPAVPSALLPMLGFGTVTALNVLTKGLIGAVFPILFVLLYLAITGRLRLLGKLRLPEATGTFLLIAAPWHILAALRNPPIAMPHGVGLPAHAGWAWFYLYNEHIARFLQRRIPHDYGQTPVWEFWLFLLIWIMPWGAFLPAALRCSIAALRGRLSLEFGGREVPLTLLLWTAVVLGFFTLSARQEYYSLPAIPALALLIGGTLAAADADRSGRTARSLLRWSLSLLVPVSTLVGLLCTYFAVTAPAPAPGTDIFTLLNSNPDLYNLSLGHLYDLTGAAMGLFRGPLLAMAAAMALVGPVAWALRRRNRTYAANLTLAAGALLMLLCVHTGLVRFYPTLGSKALADAILQAQTREAHPSQQDLLLLDGELTSGSSLIFYTGQPVSMVDARVNGPWFGSFWPDAPNRFETDASLHQLWPGPRRLFLLTYHPERLIDLARTGPVYRIAESGGKLILSNQP